MPTGVFIRPLHTEMIGQKFNRLLVLKYDVEVSKLKGCGWYLCRCDCSIEKVIRGSNLRNGSVKSCGCLCSESARKRIIKFDKKCDRTGKNNSQYYHGFCTEEKEFRKIINARDKVCQHNGAGAHKGPLAAHHLDGDHYNNNPENGSLLCRAHHMSVTRGGNIWRPNHE